MITKRQLKAILDLLKHKSSYNRPILKHLVYQDGVVKGTNAHMAVRIKVDLDIENDMAVTLENLDNYYRLMKRANDPVVFSELKWEKIDKYPDIDRFFKGEEAELNRFSADGSFLDLAFRIVSHDRQGTIRHIVNEYQHIITPLNDREETIQVMLLGVKTNY